MVTIPKIAGVTLCSFVLCVGLSPVYAAHPQAETDMSNDRGSQGNQDLIKGDSTPRKGEDEKVDETKLKEEKRSAKQEFDQRNDKKQEESRSKVPLRKLQDH
jgi:hypothetical protein